MTTEVVAASQAAAAAFALASPATASNSDLLSTQGIAAVVTTLQAATEKPLLIVEPTNPAGLNDPLLTNATAGAGVAMKNNATGGILDSQSDANDLVAHLLALSRGHKWTLG
jgi:hypothetical protein